MVASATCPATLGHDSPTDYAAWLLMKACTYVCRRPSLLQAGMAVRATYNMPPKAALNAKARFSAQGRRNFA